MHDQVVFWFDQPGDMPKTGLCDALNRTAHGESITGGQMFVNSQ